MAHTFTVTIEDEEYRAFELVVPDPVEWVEHAVRNRVREALITVVNDWAGLDGAFDPEDAEIISNIMIEEGDLLKIPRKYSRRTKLEMAKRIKIRTRAQRREDMTKKLDGWGGDNG